MRQKKKTRATDLNGFNQRIQQTHEQQQMYPVQCIRAKLNEKQPKMISFHPSDSMS